MQENFVKIRQSMIYDTRSKFFHESKDQVVIDWQDSSLSHADVVAFCLLFEAYAVSYRVRDKDGADVTSEYY